MSALPLSSPRPSAPATPRRHLDIAPTTTRRRARPTLAGALVAIAGTGAILLAQLLLSILLADGAYRIADLQSHGREFERAQQSLTERLEVLSSTQNLTANAEHLGMIASGNPVFLDLGTGQVSGTPTAAGGSLTGTTGNQVGNSLLVGTDLIVQPAQSQPPPTAAGSGTSTGSAAELGTIPSPTTR